MAVGFKIADGYVEVHAEVDENSVRRTARRAAMSFGDEVDRESRRSADRSGGNWATRFFKGIFKTSPTLSRLLPGWFEAFASPISFAAFLAGVIAAAQFVAGFLTVGLTAGIGLAFIGLAAYILKSNEQVKKAWTDTSKVVGDAFKRAAAPMIAPFVGALKIIRESMKTVEPLLHSIFASLAPAVEPLTKGLVGFGTEFLKGIDKAAPAIAEIMTALGEELPDFGKALGQFFVDLVAHKDEIISALRLIFTILQVALPVIAWLLTELTREFLITARAWNAFSRGIADAAHWLAREVPAAWGAIRDFFVDMWTSISDFFVSIWGHIVDFFTTSSDGVSSAWTTTWTAVRDFFVMIWNGITGFFSGVWSVFMGIVHHGLDDLRAIWEPFWGIFGGLISAVWDLIVSLFNLGITAIQFVLAWGLESIKAYWHASWTFVSDIAKTVWDAISSFFSTFMGGLNLLLQNSLNVMTAFWSGVWQGILDFFRWIWGLIGGTVTGALNFIWGQIVGKWNDVRDITKRIWGAVTDSISGNVHNAWDIIVNIGNRITGFISGLYDAMKTAAKHMVQGIVDGIEETIRWVTDKINKLTQMIRDHLPGSPIKRGPLSGDHGPEQGGRKISEMIAAGLAAGVPSVKAALNALVMPVGSATEQVQQQPSDNGGGGGGDSYVINLKGVWDFTDSTAAKKVVAAIHDAIEEHKRGYAKP